MKMRPKHLLFTVLLVLAAILLPAQGRSQEASQKGDSQAAQPKAQAGNRQAAATHNSQQQDEGERVFQQNCSRCHAAPDNFSPRISGTIVRHMRVRASLSQHDEEELLRFLNP